MIVITGAAGFIGSCLVTDLNRSGKNDLILVDKFDRSDRSPNLLGKNYLRKVDRDEFIRAWFEEHRSEITFVFHIGARTDTIETDSAIFNTLNLSYSKAIWKLCTENEIPLVYASSAAVYGSGERGFDDDKTNEYTPLNCYARSKKDFDQWAQEQEKKPPFWAGLRFFNVYGPNEYHKDRMASVIFHAHQQISSNGKMKLFKSHKPGIEHGHQKRDFIYVKDVTQVCMHFLRWQQFPGIYNVGTGTARTFQELTENTFSSLGLDPEIQFIDTPKDLRANYQYFTEADISKLRSAGFKNPFYDLSSGVQDYVSKYLNHKLYY